jgi:hypothetical protein
MRMTDYLGEARRKPLDEGLRRLDSGIYERYGAEPLGMPGFRKTKKPLAGMLALLGFAAAVSAGPPRDERLYFTTPPKHELRLEAVPKPPMEFSLAEDYNPQSETSAPQKPKFSLAKPDVDTTYQYSPSQAIDFSTISFLSETPVPQARDLEALVQPYQTLPWDMMPNAMGKGMKDEAVKKKSPWWKWPAIIIGTIAVAYGAYKLFFEKKPEPDNNNKPPEPVEMTINYDIYRYPTGFVKTISKQAMSSTSSISNSTTISISDTGAAEVDPNYFFLYDGNSHKANGTTGSITFTTPNTTTPNTTKDYNVVLMQKLDPSQGIIPGVSYSWMTGIGIVKSARNMIVYRQDRDNQTGPEESWTSVWSQLRSGLNVGWLKLGSITEKPLPNDGTGTFGYGYAICIDPVTGNRVDGLHGGEYIVIDAVRNDSESARRANGLAEAFENICNVQNIGGGPSRDTIQKWGVFNSNGQALLAFTFLKDSTAGIEFNPTSGSAVNLGQLASEMSMPGVASARARNASGRKASIRDIMSVMPMLMPMKIEENIGSLVADIPWNTFGEEIQGDRREKP